MTSQSDMISLKKRRSIIKGACTRLRTYVDAITSLSPGVISQLEERKKKLDIHWVEYNELQTQIELLDDKENNDRVNFEEAFYELSAKIRELLAPPTATRSLSVASPTPSGVSDVALSPHNLRLPKLDLPKFSGRFDEWRPFRDAFHAAIHSNPLISNVNKLQYLKAATTEDARKIISSIEISDDNYRIAWNRLKDRFDNKRSIVHNHLKAITDLPIMHKENAAELRQISDDAVHHIQALKALNRPIDAWDDLLIHLLSAKLDPHTARDWRKSLTRNEMPTFKQFIDFLVHQCEVLESNPNASVASKLANSRFQVNQKPKASCNTAINAKCAYCQGEHLIYKCKEFLALAIPQRIDNVRAKKICLNCLRVTTHVANKCPSGNCRICSRKHNTLLHLKSSDPNKSIDNVKPEPTALEALSATSSNVVATHCINSSILGYALLSTAVIIVKGKNNSHIAGRALLDCGSQTSFITKKFLNKLGLDPRSMDITISGISGKTTCSKYMVDIEFKSRLNHFSARIDCVVTDHITDNLPSFSIKRSEFDIPRNIQLADPNFNICLDIDILIGEAFWDLICVGQIKANLARPTLQKTKLGWILAGKLNSFRPHACHVQALHSSCRNTALQEQLSKFWEMDDVSDTSENYTIEERLCEDHFQKTVTQDYQGRYIVQIPFNQNLITNLGDSRNTALKRFIALERRFDRDHSLKNKYIEFMREYVSLGHMRPVTDQLTNESDSYYLPHHCVLKTDDNRAKIRVVFDGSCKTDSGLSLNDCMPTGPVVQPDLISILLRFRTFRYVLTADIIKMYRQVLMHPSQTKYQRILWREDNSSDVCTFELLTVTYGTKIASYLAIRSLMDLADKFATIYPLGSLHLKRDFYVDDLLTGSDSKSELLVIRNELIQLLRKGCFELSKWGSNSPDLLNNINDKDEGLVSLDKGNSRILGTCWDHNHDALQFSLSLPSSPIISSKRAILSEISKIFDPLGLLGPTVVIAKLILQELWQANVSWDESVPQDIHTEWMRLRSQLLDINQLRVPRCVKHWPDASRSQIHGFCDASERAYGACVYIRNQVAPHNYITHLLCSKSRVAPIRAVSLPRLELAAALLLAKLTRKIQLALQLIDQKTYLWSDSTITLHWISSPSRRWSTFVANRVGEIQRLTDSTSWRHISSADNPADPLSRGLLPSELIKLELWWHGPTYLRQPESQWPNNDFVYCKDDIPEQRKTAHTAIAFEEFSIINDLIANVSNLNKIIRILAYCIRITRPRNSNPTTVVISPTEMLLSINLLCKNVQKQAFYSECEALSKSRDISSSSHLRSLTPFMDTDGLIRVGGRLKNSALSFDARHQIILPRNHLLTTRIIENEHTRNLHAGLQSTIAAVRQRFWPLSVRSVTRKVINNCIKCFKAKPSVPEAIMGNLPSSRVTISQPFLHCGVDYAGPVTIREGKRRNSRNHKAYIAVFVCFSTKAVHLELVSDLTTDAFLATLKRLISRRGKPAHIHSDNATNFVGARKQIKELYNFLQTKGVQASIAEFLGVQHTAWSFIPPNAPHFGGLWEAAVKSAKYHVSRIVGGSRLTFEELQTVLCEIEAILNSRPLQPLSSDPNDMSVLTPGHFLIGSPLNSFPNLDLTNVNTNRLTRWQVIQQMQQHFWSRWSSEYLNSLQERNKWKKEKGPRLEVGKLVLIKQPGLAPLQWLTGRVELIHPGSDGIVRTATVKTSKGTYVRPLSKLAILPAQD